MDWKRINFDWNGAKTFAVAAEEGSFSAAARKLSLTQPTVGRQVRALEAELDVALIERTGRGLVLTPTGRELLDHIRRMADIAADVSRSASGRAETLSGPVRISATEAQSVYSLPPLLAELKRQYPMIEIELLSTNSLSDLRRRDADIALRAVRPTDPELLARKLRGGTANFYAAHNYLEPFGGDIARDRTKEVVFVGSDDNRQYSALLKQCGIEAEDSQISVRCSNHAVAWEMARAGAGVCVMADEIADRLPEVTRAMSWVSPFEFELWLVSHRELLTSRRVRLVFDWLADALMKR